MIKLLSKVLTFKNRIWNIYIIAFLQLICFPIGKLYKKPVKLNWINRCHKTATQFVWTNCMSTSINQYDRIMQKCACIDCSECGHDFRILLLFCRYSWVFWCSVKRPPTKMNHALYPRLRGSATGAICHCSPIAPPRICSIIRNSRPYNSAMQRQFFRTTNELVKYIL